MRPIVEIYFYPRPPRGGRHNSLNGWATDIKFLSTPSARRATKRVTQKGGDRRFLSTPSARRATSRRAIRSLMGAYFYPRPPRGGRPTRAAATDSTEPISIHALREEGDCRPWTGGSCRYDFYPRPPRGGRLFGRLKQRRKKPISIHALREEGDRTGRADNRQEREFLSTPSARRATRSLPFSIRSRKFLSTPSARRATSSFCAQFTFLRFLSTPSARRATYASRRHRQHRANFYPRPPRGGRLPSMDRRIL